jgi:hypothetical protein
MHNPGTTVSLPGCQDAERAHSQIAPVFPKSCDPEWGPILHGDRVGLLAVLGRLPLIKPVYWEDAAATSVRFPKRGQVRDDF